MADTNLKTKILLLKKGNNLGQGLAAIRELEDEMIDITDYENHFSDSTSTSNTGRIIKDNKVYNVFKSYWDLDKGVCVYLAKEEDEPYDRYPLPNNKT